MSAAMDRDLLAAEYALGALDGGERADAEKLEASDAAFRAAVLRWRDKFAALDATAPEVAPSPDLWSRIEAGLAPAPAEEARPAPAPAPRRPAARPAWWAGLWDDLRFWRPAGMAAAFASLVLFAGLVGALNRAPISPVLVAVLSTAEGRAAAVVNAYADGQVELIPLEGIAVPEGRIIEVWTLQSRERGPVSIGRMDRARKLPLNLKDLARPDINHLFELTLEPAGGSPTGKPTGPILMKGLTAKSI